MPCKQIKTSTHWWKKKKSKTEQPVARPHTNSDDFAVGLFAFRLTGVFFYSLYFYSAFGLISGPLSVSI